MTQQCRNMQEQHINLSINCAFVGSLDKIKKIVRRVVGRASFFFSNVHVSRLVITSRHTTQNLRLRSASVPSAFLLRVLYKAAQTLEQRNSEM
jgi:hypothetical protein